MNWLSRLGAGAARHPVRVIAGFVLLLMVLGGAAGAVGAGFSNGISLPGTDSQKAADLVAERFPAQAGDTATLVFATSTTGALQQAGNAQLAAVQQVLTEVGSQPEV